MPWTEWQRPVALTEVSLLDGPAEHRHRVGVVEEVGVRSDLLDVSADVEHHRDGAERAEDARRAARVADVDVDAVLLGDQDVVLPDVDAAGEDRAEDGVGAFERLAAVQRRARPSRATPYSVDRAAGRRAARSRAARGRCPSARASASWRRGKVRMSRTRLRVKPKLPAPMKAILVIVVAPVSWSAADASTGGRRRQPVRRRCWREPRPSTRALVARPRSEGKPDEAARAKVRLLG